MTKCSFHSFTATPNYLIVSCRSRANFLPNGKCLANALNFSVFVQQTVEKFRQMERDVDDIVVDFESDKDLTSRLLSDDVREIVCLSMCVCGRVCACTYKLDKDDLK